MECMGSVSSSQKVVQKFLDQAYARQRSLPFQVNLLEGITYPPEWPWNSEDFSRDDESDDALFYTHPRLVTHIDEYATKALTEWYDSNLPRGAVSILDVCSSWISHFPENLTDMRVVGVGMNFDELRANKQLTEAVVQDLNKNPKLPFMNGEFDAVVNAVSVDYLNKPLELFAEFRRVVRSEGLVAMSFSNRMFWTKAIRRWTQASEFQRLLICASYFHFSGFRDVKAQRIDAGRGDPMYVVYARANSMLDVEDKHTDL